MALQPLASLDEFYAVDDPWKYDSTSDDGARAARLLASLPARTYRRVLDVGCGNGFVTHRLPGDRVVGVDVSGRAVEWARLRTEARPDAKRFDFQTRSVFELDPNALGRFDLIVITGVLYPQYIGAAFSIVRLVIDRLLEDGGIIASAHIDDWCPWRFPYMLVHADLSPYRQYIHRLEVLEK